jgi:anthranilate synthase component 1
MPHLPDFDTFHRLAEGHQLVPAYRRLLSDALTPVTAFHLLDRGERACLFESVIGGEKVGRYSFLGVEPFWELVAHGTQVTVRGEGQPQQFTAADPLAELRRRLAGFKAVHLPELPPFEGGAIGYAGYDVVRYVENLPNAPADDRGLPDLSFAFYDQMVVFDNVSKALFVIAMARLDKAKGDARAAYDDACRRVDELVERLSQPTNLPPADIATSGPPQVAWKSNFAQHQYEDAVRKCVEYIKAGDIFQVVLSQRLALDLACDPFEVYRTLRVVNPSPFMFFLRTPEVTLVGSSPEIMCRVVDRQVTVRPLAGTRPRGATDEEDRRLAEELLTDPKERAEHVMLVDLGRNDVGRVARFGSVRLSDVMVIERYSHVMHITSNVTGTLRDDLDAFDALKACLPAGTVSGAPKVRAMQIIDQLEPHRRGPYAGAVGYIDYAGNMDTCIALRTLVVQGPKAYVQVGAGIVADSVPESEYQETLNKARGLLKAIEITRQRVAGPKSKVQSPKSEDK